MNFAALHPLDPNFSKGEFYLMNSLIFNHYISHSPFFFYRYLTPSALSAVHNVYRHIF